jgi:hypothetical protein
MCTKGEQSLTSEGGEKGGGGGRVGRRVWGTLRVQGQMAVIGLFSGRGRIRQLGCGKLVTLSAPHPPPPPPQPLPTLEHLVDLHILQCVCREYIMCASSVAILVYSIVRSTVSIAVAFGLPGV